MNVIKLTFLGDIMCKRQMIEEYCIGDNKYDFNDVFLGMKEYLAKSDFVGGNLETPIAYDNSDMTSEKWCFYSPYEFAEAVFNAGIDFVATANNHCLDRGIKGIESTVKSLDKIGFYHTGVFSDRKKDLVIEVKGLKIGLMSYTYGTNAFSNNNYLKNRDSWRVNLFQNQELSNPLTRYCTNNKRKFFARVYNRLLKTINPINNGKQLYERIEFSSKKKRMLLRDIGKLKEKKPDIIVMYMHAGGQYNSEASAYTRSLTDFLLMHGVDIVVGSHEHVVHGGVFDKINEGKTATYSLGNFDGIAGVIDPPFDKMAEYSIAWNIYIDSENIKFLKSTYSVLKTIKKDGTKYGIKTMPLAELIKSERDVTKRETLWKDMQEIAMRFSGSNISSMGVCDEYIISE